MDTTLSFVHLALALDIAVHFSPARRLRSGSPKILAEEERATDASISIATRRGRSMLWY
jgi:hypothetical protein